MLLFSLETSLLTEFRFKTKIICLRNYKRWYLKFLNYTFYSLHFFLKIRGVTSLGKMLGIRKIRGLNLHLRFGRVSITLVVSNPSVTKS